MARTLAVALIVLLAPAVATAAPRRVVIVLPPAADGDDGSLALAMQARADALLVRTGGFDEIHAKQIFRVADTEGMTRADLATAEAAAVMARRFGAERVVYGKLARRPDGLVLTAAATPGGEVIEVRLAADPVRGFEEGALALARLAAGAGAPVGGAPPATTSAAALASYARCYAIVVEQPLLVDTPMILDVARLKEAVAACRAAVAADAAFADARAALGLALALAGEDDQAVAALAAVKADAGYLPLYWLARYWMVTRYQSPDTGALALRAALDRHPYFLLARGFLALHESALHHDAAALAAWRDYRAELPKSSYVRDGISHSLARLGQHDEAIAEARAAAADAPDDREAQGELAGRYIDAGRYAEAIAILAPLAAAPRAPAEIMLRLGFAYSRLGDTENALRWLARAEAGAQKPIEWRTRARARLDRGALLVKSGQVDEGQKLLVAAERGGLERYIAAQKDDELRRMVKDAEVAQAGNVKIPPFSMQIPEESSPFLLDGAHEISFPGGRPLPQPKMFDVIRF